jgi:hypothetical protein
MDPITASILGALFAGVLTGFTEIGKKATYDAYIKLKSTLNKKFGARSGVMQAVAHLEEKPDSSHRQGVLQEEIAAVNAWQDAEVLAAARHLQTLVQQQNISLRGSTVGGSIYQVGGNQYQVDAGGLVGPGTRRGTRRVISVLLIIGGLLVSIPSAGMLPFFNGIVNSMVQTASSGPDASSVAATANSFGIAANVMIYTFIGLGILMVIGGIWLRRNLRKS